MYHLSLSGRSVYTKIVCVLFAVALSCILSACDDATSRDSTPDTVSIPNVVGMNLKEAKKKLATAGLKNIKASSLNGKMILVDSRWDVSTQEPAAGTKVSPKTEIKLAVNHDRVEKKKDKDKDKEDKSKPKAKSGNVSYKNLPIEEDKKYSSQCASDMKRLRDSYSNEKVDDAAIQKYLVASLNSCQTANRWWGAMADNPGVMLASEPKKLGASYWVPMACITATYDHQTLKTQVCEDYRLNHTNDGKMPRQ